MTLQALPFQCPPHLSCGPRRLWTLLLPSWPLLCRSNSTPGSRVHGFGLSCPVAKTCFPMFCSHNLEEVELEGF